ncbi:MAG: ImmA/IrrE family metallo-endopeptidase [Bacteroidetes bacterium]|nr:ImmA/IrrE family metallo-endopeptidase [Bacteroidota bacterium]
MIDPSTMKIPYISPAKIEMETRKILDKYWDQKLPIDIESICEFDLRIQLSPIPGLKNYSSTDGFLPRKLDEIFWDPEVVPHRIRFTIAHELGHFILHRDLIKELSFKNIQEWIDFCIAIPDATRQMAETQANRFAANILVPRSLLIEEIKKMKDIINKAIDLVGKDSIDTIKDYIAVPLKKLFGTSEQTIKIRIENEIDNIFDIIK